MLEELLIQEIKTLTPEDQSSLLKYIINLKQKYHLPTQINTRPTRQKGSAKGQLIIHTEDNEHLEAFKEYMPYKYHHLTLNELNNPNQ